MRERDHFSAISHLCGAVFSIIGLVLLLKLAIQKEAVWQIVGFSIFGGSLFLLYTISTIYHFFHVASKTRRVFQRLDHSFIFVLIAGTYTPICLTVLRGPWGWSILGVVWGIAILGIVAKNIWNVPGWLSTTIYITMGWIALIPIVPLYRALPLSALIWLFLGGIFYTLGAMFFGLDAKYPSHHWFNFHDVFHLFVIAGSVCHVVLMYYLI